MKTSSISIRSRLKRALLTTRAGRMALVGPRAMMAHKASRVAPQLGRVLAWSLRSRETANFTYETTHESKLLLAGIVAEITGRPLRAVIADVEELGRDRELAGHVAAAALAPDSRWHVDPGFLPGRRLAFYLLARSLKPARIVEAGVDKGLGAVLMSRALTLNAAEGHPGDYLGLELDAEKPITLYEGFPGRIGRIVRGDALALVRADRGPIDLFIHDTIAEAGHMTAMLEAVRPLMAPRGVVASTWTTPTLIEHAVGHGLELLTHQEETAGHWFPGDRVAFLYGYGVARAG